MILNNIFSKVFGGRASRKTPQPSKSRRSGVRGTKVSRARPSAWAQPILAPCPPDKFREILSRHFSGTRTEEDFLSKIADVEVRAADDTLRVAVIGEFSSGKSTFINALMKRRLLKSATQATTAAGTHIRSGKKLSLKATTTDGEETVAEEKKLGALNRFLKAKGAEKCSSFEEALASLSADERIAKDIVRIDVSVPCEFRIPELEIIDTPGFNSGEKKGARHCALSAEIAKSYADCAIVVIPALQANTADLLNFLKTNMGSYLNECVFVLSQADRLDEDMTEFLVDVRETLRKTLSLKKQPEVFPVNSQSELREGDSPELALWRERFAEAENALRERLTRNRARLLGVRLKTLCETLRDSLAKELDCRKTEIDSEKRFLERNKISRIEEATQEMLNAVVEDLNKIVEKFSARIDRLEDETAESAKQSARERIRIQVQGNFFTTREDIEELLRDDVLPDARGQFLTEAAEIQNELFAAVPKIRNKFLKKFEAHYADFPSLKREISVPEAQRPRMDVEFELDSEVDFSGMDVLDVFADRLFGDRSKSVRRYEKMYLPQIQDYLDALKDKYCEHFDEKIMPAVFSEFKELAEAHIRRYRKAVSKLLEERERKLADLREHSSSIREDRKFLEKIDFETSTKK